MVMMIKIIALLVFVAASLAEERDPGDENTSDLKQAKVTVIREYVSFHDKELHMMCSGKCRNYYGLA